MADAALIRRAFRGMDSELCRRKSEDEPSVSQIDMLETEYVPEDVAQGLRLGGVEQSMNTGDGHPTILRDPPPAVDGRAWSLGPQLGRIQPSGSATLEP